MSKKVKTIKFFKEVKLAGIDAKESLSMLQELDRNKNVIREVHYSDEEEEQVTETTYNEKGLVVSEKVHFIIDDLNEELIIEYNDANKRTKETKAYNGEVQEIKIREYDANNNLVKGILSDGDGEMEEYDTYEYNEHQKVISYKRYNYENKVILKSDVLYNSENEVIEENRWSEEDGETKILFDTILKDKSPDSTAYNKEGKITHRVRNTYNEKGQLEKEVVESTIGGLRKLTTNYVYNEDGKLTETRILDGKETLLKQTSLLYNENGNVITETLYEDLPNMASTNIKLRYEYEYYEE